MVVAVDISGAGLLGCGCKQVWQQCRCCPSILPFGGAVPVWIISTFAKARRANQRHSRWRGISPAAWSAGQCGDSCSKRNLRVHNIGGIARKPCFQIIGAKHDQHMIKGLLRQQNGPQRRRSVEMCAFLRVVQIRRAARQAFLNQLDIMTISKQLCGHADRPAAFKPGAQPVIKIAPAV